MKDIMMFLGFTVDNAFPHVGGFWSTPVGLTISGVIVLCCLIVLFNRKIKETLFEAIWYSVSALTMGCAFIGGWNPNYDPHNIVKTFLFLMLFKFIRDVYVKIQRAYK